MTVQTVYLLKGRCIDGTCWRTGGGWTNLQGLAQAFRTPEGVAGALAEAKWEYDHTSLDDTTGCLEVQTMPQAEYLSLQASAYEQMEREDALWDEQDGGLV